MQALPRMWQMHSVISLQPAAEKKLREPMLMPKGTIASQDPAAAFIMPEPLTHIPLDPPCMPSLAPTQGRPGNAQAAPTPNPMLNPASAHVAPVTITHQDSANSQSATWAGQAAQTITTAQQGRVQHSADTFVQSESHVSGSSPKQQASYSTQQKASLQHDAVIQSNAACQEADLILTEGAYQCLTTTGASGVKLGYKGNWEIPFTVQHKPRQFSEYPKAPSNPQLHQQQVLLDMPLPARLLNQREKLEMLYQHAVCQMGCSLFSQLKQRAQQKAAAVSATERDQAADEVNLPQPEHKDDQMESDENLTRPYSPSDHQAPPMPYPPSQEAPYSPSSHVPYLPTQEAPNSPKSHIPYSPTQEAPNSPSSHVPYSPTQEAPYFPNSHRPYSPFDDPMETIHSETGLTENSSLMPLQHPPDTAPEAEPMLAADAQQSFGHSARPNASLFAQPAAPSADDTPQLNTQEHSPAGVDTLAGLTGHTVDGPDQAQSNNTDAQCSPDNAPAHDAAVADGHGEYVAHPTGISNPKSGQGQVTEAGLSYRRYRLEPYSIVTRTQRPLDVIVRASDEVKHATCLKLAEPSLQCLVKRCCVL